MLGTTSQLGGHTISEYVFGLNCTRPVSQEILHSYLVLCLCKRHPPTCYSNNNQEHQQYKLRLA